MQNTDSAFPQIYIWKFKNVWQKVTTQHTTVHDVRIQAQFLCICEISSWAPESSWKKQVIEQIID